MTQKAHPHARALRLLADNVPITEFEVKFFSWARWENAENFTYWIFNPEQWQVRRKQKMHRLGEHTFPAPATEAPEMGTKYFIVMLVSIADYEWCGDITDHNWLMQGRAHLTEEAAEAHHKAIKAVMRGTPV